MPILRLQSSFRRNLSSYVLQLFVATLLFVSSPPANSQIRQHRFTNIGVDQGLSHYRLYDILEDEIGFLWVATMDGLDRYDGYDVASFKQNDADSNSLADHVVTALCQDSSGTLWVGTKNGVLHRFLYSEGRFIQYHHDPRDSSTIDGRWIRSIYCDRNGTVWICSLGGGLSKLLSADSTGHAHFQHFRNDPDDRNSLISNNVYAACMDNSMGLWVGTDRGLDLLRPGWEDVDHVRLSHHDSDESDDRVITSILVGQSGNLWVGTGGQGLISLDTITNEETYLQPKRDDTGLSDNFVTSIFEQDRRFLWVGTQNGLNRLDKTTGRVTQFKHDPRDPNSLPNNYVTRITSDRSGNIWIATDRGLSKFLQRTEQLVHYKHEPDRFSSQVVTSLHEDHEGRLWLGTDSGLKRFDWKNGPSARPAFTSLTTEYVQSIIEDRLGNTWVGTMGGGLYRFEDSKETTFRRYVWPNSQSWSVMSICEDSDGNLWVGTHGDGLLRFNPSAQSFEQGSQAFPDYQEIGEETVPVVTLDRSGVMWIGTEGSGLIRLPPGVSSCQYFRYDPHDSSTISSDRIRALFEDKAGNFWVATANGLDNLDRKTGKFSRVLVHGGDFEGQILAILSDDRGRLWLSTMQNGIYCFDPSGESLQSYDFEDGLQSNRFYPAACKRSTGESVFGGENGFNVFNPDSIPLNPHMPTIVLTEFRVLEERFEGPSVPPSMTTVRLPYDKNALSFRFAALDHTAPEKNQYRYKLEGVNKRWVTDAGRRYASYAKVDPGEYVFRVQASNNDGVWTKNDLALSIVIDPPYWLTWWFKTLAAGIIIGILVILYRYRISKILEVQNLRLSISRDLHDDIGSSLGSIALASDELQSSDSLPVKAEQQLLEISSIARKTAETVRDIVWVMKPICDRLDNLLLKLKDETTVLLKGVEYTFDVRNGNNDMPVDMVFNHNVLLIYKEILHNIAKHSKARRVEINLVAGSDNLNLTVSDDGIGFDTSVKPRGDGLRNMEKRCKAIGGSLHIETNRGVGTRVSVTARIPQMRYVGRNFRTLYSKKNR